MRSNGLSVKFIGLTSLFSQRQHTAPLQRVIKELPAFLRPCSVQLLHFGAIAALEPERQAGRIALTVVFRIQHPLAVGTVLNTVQMQQPIEHLGSAAVLFGDLRSRNQRIGIAQLRFIAASIFYLLGSVLLATAILSYLMQQSQGMEALQMLIGGFVIFMIPQVVGGVVVLLELAAVMLRQIWYI